MTATEFRARRLGLMNEVADAGREIVTTKRRRPLAHLVPYRSKQGAPLGPYRDQIQTHGDIDAPIDVKWET